MHMYRRKAISPQHRDMMLRDREEQLGLERRMLERERRDPIQPETGDILIEEVLQQGVPGLFIGGYPVPPNQSYESPGEWVTRPFIFSGGYFFVGQPRTWHENFMDIAEKEATTRDIVWEPYFGRSDTNAETQEKITGFEGDNPPREAFELARRFFNSPVYDVGGQVVASTFLNIETDKKVSFVLGEKQGKEAGILREYWQITGSDGEEYFIIEDGEVYNSRDALIGKVDLTVPRWIKERLAEEEKDVSDREDSPKSITCPSCDSHTYNVLSVNKDGVAKLRCSACGEIFEHEGFSNPKESAEVAEPPRRFLLILYYPDQRYDQQTYEAAKAFNGLVESGGMGPDGRDLLVTFPSEDARKGALQLLLEITEPLKWEEIMTPTEEEITEEESEDSDLANDLPHDEAPKADEVEWRNEQFLKMGFPPEQAEQLSIVKADWQRVRQVLEQGASLDQAFQIFSRVKQAIDPTLWHLKDEDPERFLEVLYYDAVERGDYYEAQKLDAQLRELEDDHDRKLDTEREDAAFGPPQSKTAAFLDTLGTPLTEGNFYTMHSHKYKVPDIVRIITLAPDMVVATVEGDNETIYPIKIDSQEFEKESYSFEPYTPQQQQITGVWREAKSTLSVKEQKDIIEEKGEARNKHKLNLEGTHYIDQISDKLDIYFLW